MKFCVLLAVIGIILPAFAYPGNVGNGEGNTMVNRQRLRNRLFDNYDRLNYPDDLKVELGLSLISFDVDEPSNSVKVFAWLKETWVDDRLKWDIDDIPVENFRFGNDEAWKPDIALYNSVDLQETTPCGNTNMILYPSGKILLVNPCTYQAYCEELTHKNAHTLNAEFECELKFGSWTLDGYTMDLQSYGNETKIDTTDFRDGSNWKVLRTSVSRNTKYYPCCKEPYISLSFKIRFQKKSG